MSTLVRAANSTITVTGTASETQMRRKNLQLELIAPKAVVERGFRVLAMGACAGTAGVKTVKLYLGSTAIATVSVAQGAEPTWLIDAEVWFANNALTSQRIVLRSYEGAAIETIAATTTSVDLSTGAGYLRTTGTLAETADTITQTLWVIERI
jgi:hypothetical protein